MKKALSIILCIGLCIMFVIPVSAEELPMEIQENSISKDATNYFSKTLKLNSVNGISPEVVTYTPGSISGSAQISSISFYVRVSGNPFILYVQAPDGTMHSFVINKSENVIIDDLNDCTPSGTWKIWIETLGIASTATITIKMNYSY